MNRYPALAGLRLGCVQYLNSKPLIHGYDGPVLFDHPAGLARDLARGALDVALVPAFEALRTPEYVAVDDVAIACEGPVFSVILAHRRPLAEVRSIVLDPASLTSSHLLRVLLAGQRVLQPEYLENHDGRAEADAALLIGNQAIAFRGRAAGTHQLLDLGEEWLRWTGLPFVFALWLMRRELPNARAIADELRSLKRSGVAGIPEIVRADKAYDPDLSARYLTQHIRFDLGAREKAGLDRFRELLVKHEFIPATAALLRFI